MMSTRTEPIQIERITTDAGDVGICLWVAVDHAIMAQQIRFLRDDIRKACTRHAQIDHLYQIRTRLKPGAGIRPDAPKRPPKRVTFAEKRRLALDVASIKDRRLRNAVFRARMAQLANSDEEQ